MTLNLNLQEVQIVLGLTADIRGPELMESNGDIRMMDKNDNVDKMWVA